MPKPRQFGPFEIQKVLGRGGMGVVYQAVYHKTGQTVALKVLSPEFAGDEQVRKRFDREMEILKRLDHEHVVSYYVGGRKGQQHFYAMELMDGGSLDDLLQEKGRLSWEQTIDIGKATADALYHAHTSGIVHRDLKPANLFLTKDQQLKLGDFGIARDLQRTALTAAGKTVGTYAYMAPEQISGKPSVSHKTDQYALGCVLVELLTGRPPFEADNAAEMMMQHLEMKPPSIRERAPDCPVWLEQVIVRLLEKDPEDRYFDARAVVTALDDVVQKELAGASISRQTVRGDVTVATQANDPELRRLLRTGKGGNKKKRRRRRREYQPWYERTWFLVTALVLLAAGLTWALWPLSAEERFSRGEQLMKQASRPDTDDADRALLLQDAEEHFRKLLDRFPDSPYADEAREYLLVIEIDRLRRQAESRRKRNLPGRSAAEAIYMDARRAEVAGDRVIALRKYRDLINLVEGREQDRPYLTLAKKRTDAIYREGTDTSKLRALIEDALKRADAYRRDGKTIEADRIWNAIVSEFGDNEEVAPLVEKARARLAGRKKKASQQPGQGGGSGDGGIRDKG